MERRAAIFGAGTAGWITDVAAYKYGAFISYAHRDREWAQWLHRALERYQLPRLPETGAATPRRIGRCFRDEDELRAGELGEQIERALTQSRTLIVVCSPNAARSKWVSDEILQFKRRRGDRDVFALIVDGTPHAGGPEECLPEPLRHRVSPEGRISDEPVDPLAPDVRRLGKDGALLRLVAGLLDLDFEDLFQRERLRVRQQRRRAVGLTVIGALLVAFGAVGIGLAWKLNQEVMTARSRLLAAASAAELSKGHVDNATLLAILAAPPKQDDEKPGADAQRALDAVGAHSGQTKAVMADLVGQVDGLRISDGGRFLAAADDRGTLILYSMGDAGRLFDIGHVAITMNKAVFDVSASGRHLVIASRGGGAEIWSTMTRRRLATLDTTAGELLDIRVISESDDGELRLLLVSSEGAISTVGWSTGQAVAHELGRTPHALSSAWISDDRTVIAAQDRDSSALSLIDAATGRKRHSFGGYRSSISTVLFDTTGGLIYTASYDKSVRVFDLQRGNMLASAEGDGPALWITQPPDRSGVLATFPAGTINDWNFGRSADGNTGLHLVATAPLHQRWLSKAKYSPSGEYLATVGRDRLLNVWDRRFGLVARFPGHATGVVALDISTDGRIIATGDEDGVIRLWNAPSMAGERANGSSVSNHTVDELCRNLPLGRKTLLVQAAGQAKLRAGMAAPEEITSSNIVKENETDPCHRRSAGMLSWALGG